MIKSYSRAQVLSHPLLLSTMHEDRKTVFVDTLQWDLPTVGAQEHDRFDNEAATYLIGADGVGRHWVSMRLLDTDKPHILGSLFPFLCEKGVPTGPHIREITRYLATPRAKASERQLARNMVCRALIEYGLLHKIEAYTAVVDLSFLSQILAAGWRCDPLGMPQLINGSVIGAFCLHVEEDTIGKMVRSWRYDKPALFEAPFDIRMAA